MRYSILTQQPRAIEWKFSLSECFLFAFLFEVPAWAENVDIEGETFYHCSRFKVLEEMPILTDKADTVYRLFKELDLRGVIKYQKLDGRDFIKITEKGTFWNKSSSEKNPSRAKNSENFPNELGKKSEKNSEKNPTDYIIREDIITTIDKDTPNGVFDPENVEDYEAKAAAILEAEKAAADLKAKQDAEKEKVAPKRKSQLSPVTIAMFGSFDNPTDALNAWNDWEQYKRDEKSQCFKTEQSRQLAIDNLCQLAFQKSEKAKKIIDQSRGQLWAGLFPLRQQTNIAQHVNNSKIIQSSKYDKY